MDSIAYVAKVKAYEKILMARLAVMGVIADACIADKKSFNVLVELFRQNIEMMKMELCYCQEDFIKAMSLAEMDK